MTPRRYLPPQLPILPRYVVLTFRGTDKMEEDINAAAVDGYRVVAAVADTSGSMTWIGTEIAVIMERE